ncbi:hypothetical protein Tco_1325238 [Tanacetum coccineum]
MSVIEEFYGECGGFNYANIPPGNSGIWMDVLKAIRSIEDIDSNFKSSFVRKVSVKSRTGGVWPTVFEGAFGIGGIRLEAEQLMSSPFLSLASFKVKSLAKNIQNLTLSAHALGVHHKWNSWILRKCFTCVDEGLELVEPRPFGLLSSFSIGYMADGNMFGSGDSILAKILHGNTLAEYMILFGADNRPPMLDNDLYDSWKSRMELYMQNKEQGRMILESVENCPLIWPTIKENGVTRTKKYAKLSDSS